MASDENVSENAYKWTANQIAFQVWLATPKFERTPPTQGMFADHLGVNERTLSRWKEIEGFEDAVIDLARKYLRGDLPDIYGALRREAIKGSYQHIKLSLELTGEHVDSLDITSDGEPIKGYVVFNPAYWDEDDESGDETD